MTQDPLDALSEFYDACHRATAPNRETQPRRISLAVPVGGLALGLVAALVVTVLPTAPSPEACRRTVEAIAFRQQQPAEPVRKEGLNTAKPRRTIWRA